MYGAVDLALQPLSTQFDERLAIAWFPYTVRDYASAREAFTEGGYIFEAVEAMLEGGAVEILAPYAVGMGGAGFTSAVPQPRNPDAEQEMRIRLSPGGTTHLELMKRFGSASRRFHGRSSTGRCEQVWSAAWLAAHRNSRQRASRTS